MEKEHEIRIYVACLASYNNGRLHGRWINARQDAWGIYDEVAAMLRASPITDAEEWAIHDYEGFGGYQFSEYEGLEDVAAIAAFIGQHGKLAGELLSYFGSLDEARSAIEDRYAGEYESVSDFARELSEETQAAPANLASYIDYDRMARDLEISDVLAFETDFGEVHVFWSH